MPKKALVILADGFEEIEGITVIDILRRAEIDVTIAGLSDLKVKASRGVIIMAEKKLDDCGADFDVVVLPGGGFGSANLAKSEKVKDLVIKMNNSGKIVAAICAAPAVVLAPLGILKNKTATCYPSMEEAFSKDTKFKEDKVVVDGNLITSRGPGTALLFALAIVEKLVGRGISEKLKEATIA